MTTQQKLIKSSSAGLSSPATWAACPKRARRWATRAYNFSRQLLSDQESLRGARAGGLKEISRRKPNRRNRVPEEIEAAIVQIAIEYPAYGQVRAASKLLELKGQQISPAGRPTSSLIAESA